eukprot:PhM_4_TR14148/c0_g1_i1/m.104246
MSDRSTAPHQQSTAPSSSSSTSTSAFYKKGDDPSLSSSIMAQVSSLVAELEDLSNRQTTEVQLSPDNLEAIVARLQHLKRKQMNNSATTPRLPPVVSVDETATTQTMPWVPPDMEQYVRAWRQLGYKGLCPDTCRLVFDDDDNLIPLHNVWEYVRQRWSPSSPHLFLASLSSMAATSNDNSSGSSSLWLSELLLLPRRMANVCYRLVQNEKASRGCHDSNASFASMGGRLPLLLQSIQQDRNRANARGRADLVLWPSATFVWMSTAPVSRFLESTSDASFTLYILEDADVVDISKFTVAKECSCDDNDDGNTIGCCCCHVVPPRSAFLAREVAMPDVMISKHILRVVRLCPAAVVTWLDLAKLVCPELLDDDGNRELTNILREASRSNKYFPYTIPPHEKDNGGAASVVRSLATVREAIPLLEKILSIWGSDGLVRMAYESVDAQGENALHHALRVPGCEDTVALLVSQAGRCCGEAAVWERVLTRVHWDITGVGWSLVPLSDRDIAHHLSAAALRSCALAAAKYHHAAQMDIVMSLPQWSPSARRECICEAAFVAAAHGADRVLSVLHVWEPSWVHDTRVLLASAAVGSWECVAWLEAVLVGGTGATLDEVVAFRSPLLPLIVDSGNGDAVAQCLALSPDGAMLPFPDFVWGDALHRSAIRCDVGALRALLAMVSTDVSAQQKHAVKTALVTASLQGTAAAPLITTFFEHHPLDCVFPFTLADINTMVHAPVCDAIACGKHDVLTNLLRVAFHLSDGGEGCVESSDPSLGLGAAVLRVWVDQACLGGSVRTLWTIMNLSGGHLLRTIDTASCIATSAAKGGKLEILRHWLTTSTSGTVDKISLLHSAIAGYGSDEEVLAILEFLALEHGDSTSLVLASECNRACVVQALLDNMHVHPDAVCPGYGDPTPALGCKQSTPILHAGRCSANPPTPPDTDADDGLDLEALFAPVLNFGLRSLTYRRRGCGAVHAAAWHGHLSVLKLLCERNATLTLTTGDGVGPLVLAAYRGHSECVRYLIDASPDGAVDADFVVAAAVGACERASVEVLRMLAGHRLSSSVVNDVSPLFRVLPLHAAARLLRADVVEALLQLGSNPNALITFREASGPALVHAVCGGCAGSAASSPAAVDILERLFHHGAQANATASEGHTALFTAAYVSTADVCRVLTQNGASARMQYADTGLDPLAVALLSPHHDAVQRAAIVAELVGSGAQARVSHFDCVPDDDGDLQLCLHDSIVRMSIESATVCSGCGTGFGITRRRHPCWTCEGVFCKECCGNNKDGNNNNNKQNPRSRGAVCARCQAAGGKGHGRRVASFRMSRAVDFSTSSTLSVDRSGSASTASPRVTPKKKESWLNRARNSFRRSTSTNNKN